MRFLIFISFVLFISNQNKLENPIIRALKSDHPKIKKVTEKIDQHELQIMISYIDEKNNSYDYDFSAVRTISSGSHEVFIGFDQLMNKKTPNVSPRFF